MSARARTDRHCGPSAHWEMAVCSVPHALRRYVHSWVGYEERTLGPSCRRELPGPRTVVIVEFEPRLSVFDRDGRAARRYAGGFVAGLDDAASLTEHAGYQAGMQINLTPLGARAWFRRPLDELARQVVALPDVLSRDERSLAARLGDTRDWTQRFGILGALLERHARDAGSPHAGVQWATSQIAMRRGALDVGSLSRELGVSRKHLSQLFREHVGMPPKLYASLTRFDQVMQRLKRATSVRWAELAAEFGYADQAHLGREIRRFSGLTPTLALQLVAASPSACAPDPEP